MLGSIAVCPIFFNHIWEHNRNKLIIGLIFGIPTILWLLINGYSHEFFDTIIFNYIPFIILLGSLFVISGGIFVDGDIEAKPVINTTFMVIGAVLASIMGTTGAAMLLIRVVLHTNKYRKFNVHTILFFIAIVANCGGLLSPLGDPPLFMMYLRGASFTWFLKLFPEWLFVNGLLCIIFFFVDSYYWKKEDEKIRIIERENIKKIKIHGKLNFIWLTGVVLAVAFINPNVFEILKSNHNLSFVREAVIILMTLLSLMFTTHLTRMENNFSWKPIEEVAYLFLGIFITMVPCILYLETNANNLGILSPASFYYFSGTLSSFLDNTPTAVTFYSLAEGLVKSNGISIVNTNLIAGIPESLMKAISVGAVLFGSMTYIGNGPNFMVKSIAESHNIKMPHFFAYMFKFSIIILLPIFILTQLLFIFK